MGGANLSSTKEAINLMDRTNNHILDDTRGGLDIDLSMLEREVNVRVSGQCAANKLIQKYRRWGFTEHLQKLNTNLSTCACKNVDLPEKKRSASPRRQSSRLRDQCKPVKCPISSKYVSCQQRRRVFSLWKRLQNSLSWWKRSALKKIFQITTGDSSQKLKLQNRFVDVQLLILPA